MITAREMGSFDVVGVISEDVDFRGDEMGSKRNDL